ncbi:hypothetical protein LOTGIDRAFT_236974 [Lottia gigantea]|uniref:Single domain-containing protein n=1 Tax=Lottia gigantea TaxID=225164 RepID=V3ZEI3_LOTGI|nr:hypothetical protein LOTGIDRAFT_236974 [Lottia gigantea]ESO82482.1 hypothetical protein LOTGIDRAFT_236974 [Lottia gigantea]
MQTMASVIGVLVLCFIGLVIGLVPKPVEESYCPVNWREFEGHCLFRPSIEPDDICHSLGAKSVFNLFCMKGKLLRPIEERPCPTNWMKFHQHCLYVPSSDAKSYCPLHNALVVYDSICIKGQTDLLKLKGKSKAVKIAKVPDSLKEEERACCPNGFGK